MLNTIASNIKKLSFTQLEELSEISGLSEEQQLAIIDRECCISSRNVLQRTSSLKVVNTLFNVESETLDVALYDSSLTTPSQKLELLQRCDAIEQ